jgi:DNA-binding beta-propeller fold protein YncE
MNITFTQISMRTNVRGRVNIVRRFSSANMTSFLFTVPLCCRKNKTNGEKNRRNSYDKYLILIIGIDNIVYFICTAAPLMLRWNSTGSTVAGSAGVTTAAANKLDRPYSLTLDSSNSLYIADQQNNRIQKWLMGSSTGSTLAGQSSGMMGFTLSDLNQPSGVLLDSSGNIYVADTSNNRVQFWPTGASSGTTVAGILGRRRNIKHFIIYLESSFQTLSRNKTCLIFKSRHEDFFKKTLLLFS